jgi:glycosyltransferase involved in cell wall biosynthesis
MKKKVTFVLNVRFPTEKAYGVTTSLTAKVIKELGNYDVEVITPILGHDHYVLVDTREIKMPFASLYDYFLQENKILSYIAFNIWKLFYPFKVVQKLRREKNLVWSRDVYSALVFSFFGFRTVCEIHRTPSVGGRICLFQLKKSSDNTFVFITEELQNKLKVSDYRSVIAPMSVDKSELVKKNIGKINKNFVVGYLGSTHSSGIKISLRSLIDAADLLESSNPEVIFRLVGVDKQEFKGVNFPSNFEFIPRVHRSKVMGLIDSFDAGLVIYPENKYYIDSFPIKIVEYASRGIPIIASNTTAHRNLLGDDKALYFNPDLENSLSKSIKIFMEDDSLRLAISENLFNWVQNLTYENRALKVLMKNEFY